MWVDFVIKKILGIQGKELRDYFDDLSLEKVIPKLLQYFFEKSDCDNLIWIAKEEWFNLHLRAQNPEAIGQDQFLNQSHLLSALKPISESEITQIVKNFSAQSSMPQCVKVEGISHLVFPVKNFRNHQTMAYVVLKSVRGNRPERLLGKISSDLQFMERHLTFCWEHWEIQKLSFMDDLTGLFNQKYLSLVLENEIHRSQRESSKFSVMFMDVDFFKSVNDTKGHWVGSRLLVDIGSVLKENIRKSDYAFRYGGDEFVVVLTGTDSGQAVIAAERLRSMIEKTEFLVDGASLHLTLSIGLATFPDHAKTYKDIIKMADEAMYCGKNKSRNIVFVAS